MSWGCGLLKGLRESMITVKLAHSKSQKVLCIVLLGEQQIVVYVESHFLEAFKNELNSLKPKMICICLWQLPRSHYCFCFLKIPLAYFYFTNTIITLIKKIKATIATNPSNLSLIFTFPQSLLNQAQACIFISVVLPQKVLQKSHPKTRLDLCFPWELVITVS